MDTADVNYMLIWIAVQGLAPDQALAELDMELSEDAEMRDASGWPNFSEHDYFDRIFMGRLPGNWLLLFGSLEEEDKARLTRLVKFGPAFAGDLSRIGCFAEGRSYADGQEVWSVDYDFESQGRSDLLSVEGDVPAHLASIISEAHAAIAAGLGLEGTGVDVLFEVPGKLSKAICGFSPHVEPPAGFRWSMLQRIGGEPAPEPQRPGFFARLFGHG